MHNYLTSRLRWLLFTLGLLTLALAITLPFAAQQLPPFDEARIVDDMSKNLQLAPEQIVKLRELIAAHRPRIEQLQREATPPPGSQRFGELRAQFERERRAMLNELLPSLNPEQQTRMRNLLANQPPPGSVIAPVKPVLPTGALAAGERLIAQPVSASATRTRRATSAPAALTEEQKILHLLNRAGFGPRPGDIEHVRQIGIERYLDEQLHPEDLSDDLLNKPLQALNTLQMSAPEAVQMFMPPPPPRPSPTPTPAATATVTPDSAQAMTAPPQSTATPRPTPAPPPRNPQQPLTELQQAKLLRAVFSERQLQEVMVDFWFNHFNVFAGKDNIRWLATSYERDTIRPHALGKFKELLVATAQSPAMLYYLDNFLSQAEPPPPPPRKDAANNPQPAPTPARRPGLNENYGRELLELHTLGVDGGYTQQDVIAVARSFTGWTITQQPNIAFVFRPRAHDREEKIVLGQRIAPGGGIEDGLRVLDLLAHHPATARFISYKLCQRFITDEPLAPLVEHIAGVFAKTDGDIRAVVRAILTAPEFYSPKHYRNKIKSPLELTVSTLRATGAASDGMALVQWLQRMGEPLYQCIPPTGYSEESARWLSSASLLERMNFALAVAQNRLNGTRVEVNRFVSLEAFNDQTALLNQLLALFIHSDVSAETRANLLRVLDEARSKAVPARYDEATARKNNEQLISSIAALILGSQEFQVK